MESHLIFRLRQGMHDLFALWEASIATSDAGWTAEHVRETEECMYAGDISWLG